MGELAPQDHGAKLGLGSLLTVWPVTEAFIRNLPAGDLISLSRTSTTFRALTHDVYIEQQDLPFRLPREGLKVGQSQTTHWQRLKALAPFECSSQAHTKGTNIHPCKFCSTPICEACIVRDSFLNRGESTFRNRTRHFCEECWANGNLRMDHRFPTGNSSREHIWHGRPYSQRGGFCNCTMKSDAWLCIPCKRAQNATFTQNQPLYPVMSSSQSSSSMPLCYGECCTNPIDNEDRDRRRICLWCSRGLPRQIGGEERHKWEAKNIEIRAAEAESRSRDIEEWARNRFKLLTMSRREMRGTEACVALNGHDGPQNDRPMFIRHFDAVNYARNGITGPTPDQVYASKANGRFVYDRSFAKAIGRRGLSASKFDFQLEPVVLERIQNVTKQDGLRMSRTNKEIYIQTHHDIPTIAFASPGRSYLRDIIQAGAQMAEAKLLDDIEIDDINETLKDAQGLKVFRDILFHQLHQWRKAQQGLCEWHQPPNALVLAISRINNVDLTPPSFEEAIDSPDRVVHEELAVTALTTDIPGYTCHMAHESNAANGTV